MTSVCLHASIVTSAGTWCHSGPLSSVAISDDFYMLERGCCTMSNIIKPRISQQDTAVFVVIVLCM